MISLSTPHVLIPSDWLAILFSLYPFSLPPDCQGKSSPKYHTCTRDTADEQGFVIEPANQDIG